MYLISKKKIVVKAEVREDVKGIGKFVFADGSDSEKLHLHISEVEPGERKHAPHAHSGQEIFYVFSGKGRVDVSDESFEVSGSEAVQVHCELEHGIINVGEEPLRYAVTIAR